MSAACYSYLSTPFLDITEAETIEIVLDDAGNMWINVDGLCRVRAMKTKEFVIDDRSTKTWKKGRAK